MKKMGPIWEGVYRRFQDVPSEGKGFNSKKWIENSLIKIKSLREAAKAKRTIPTVVKYQESILPVITAVLHNDLKKIRILDFGGGIGFTYYQVAESLYLKKNLEYHIIEVDAVCETGREFFKDEENVFFHRDFPENIGEVNIVHTGSSLHYVEDWRKILNRLCRYRPKFFLFTDLAAGDIPTYASAQKYYKSRIPVWFFNIKEIISAMVDDGFKLIFRSSFDSKIMGTYQPYPQDNFEEKYRLGYSCSLLFAQGIKK